METRKNPKPNSAPPKEPQLHKKMRVHFRCLICTWLTAFAQDEAMEDIFAALGQELEHEDCSLLGGRDCDAGTAFLQTKSAYRWTSLGAETGMAPMAPSFFQMGEEVTSQVGVVHGASTASATSATVGEVHMDRTRQMRQWQEDAVEIYTDTHAASATAKTAATVVAATISESRGALAKMQIFLTASGLWLAVLFFLLVVLVATWLGRWWAAPAKAETEAEAAEETDDTAKPSVQFIPRPSCESAEQRGAQSNELRRYVQEAHGISSEEDLASLLPEASGYDCALSRPASSGQAVRLAVRIEGPLPGGPPPLGLLRAPLSQRSCVFFSAAVEEIPGKGESSQSPLQKKVVDSVDFQVSLVGAPSIRIDVTGSDLTVLDALEDNWTPSQSLNSLPRPWREFLEVSQSTTGKFRFREDVLLVGSEVVLCGELLRDSRARFFLQPSKAPKAGCESWRTSWECESSKLGPSVLASNDTTLAEEPKIDSSFLVSSFETADFPQPFLML